MIRINDMLYTLVILFFLALRSVGFWAGVIVVFLLTVVTSLSFIPSLVLLPIGGIVGFLIQDYLIKKKA
jgi:hypothetical protein